MYAQNPLGKVPVLLRPGASAIFYSDVICEYLDGQHSGRRLIPPDGEARWQALRLQAVAQGLAEAGISYRWETERRPAEFRYEPLRDGYAGKLIESYDWLERNLDDASEIHVGHIAIATALSWLEFRELPGFRVARDGSRRSRLSGWFDTFSKRPSMRATPLSGQTQD